MNGIADKYSDKGVGSIFLYTHEAHPGEQYPMHRTWEDKVRHGHALRDVKGVKRPIYLDALDGACHRRYGGMPNMTWIFNRSGIPLYKSDWTDANSVENGLVYYLDVIQRRRNREKLAPFRVQRLDYRNQDREQFYAGLAENGPRAVTEFDEMANSGSLNSLPD